MKRDFLYRTIELNYKKRKSTEKTSNQRRTVYRNIKQLYANDTENHYNDYYVTKYWYFVIILGISLLLAGLLFLTQLVSGALEGNKIHRPENGELTVPLIVETEEESAEVEVSVGQRRFSPRELDELYSLVRPALEKEMLEENKNLKEVMGDLSFPNNLEGLPFLFSWETDNYSLVKPDGTVCNDEMEEGSIEVNITVTASYYEYEKEEIFTVLIYPPYRTSGEIFKRKILAAIHHADELQKNEGELLLPGSLDGQTVQWKEKRKYGPVYILILGLILNVSIFYLKDYDLHKTTMEREKELEKEFPEFVSKLTVYLGAGLSLRSTWDIISKEYLQRSIQDNKKETGVHYLATELNITSQEIKSGISELEAYERFGKRCRSSLYVKFTTLLIQNVKKGSTNLAELLLTESRIAFEHRKNQARKQGEEAGTKLLFPMMMLMGMIMVMIMVPAFANFN